LDNTHIPVKKTQLDLSMSPLIVLKMPDHATAQGKAAAKRHGKKGQKLKGDGVNCFQSSL